MKADIIERLKFLELCLLLLGEFKKGYFQLLFDTQKAQHRKDLRAYEEECPNNLKKYDPKLKRYLPTNSFSPKFLPSDAEGLMAYQKYAENLISSRGESSPFHQIEYLSNPFLNPPNITLWSALNRAITRKQVLDINYAGLRKDAAQYHIQPLAIIHNGFRWHVRSYVVGENRYRDFVLSRINNFSLSVLEFDNAGTLDKDDKWNISVELTFRVHPKLTEVQRRTVEEDYGMEKGKKVIRSKICNIQHILKLTHTGLDNELREAHLFPIILDYEKDCELVNILNELKQKRLI